MGDIEWIVLTSELWELDLMEGDALGVVGELVTAGVERSEKSSVGYSGGGLGKHSTFVLGL